MTNNFKESVEIFTDGSCSTEHKVGGWAALILLNNNQIMLEGRELETTHNRMELLSVIKAIEHSKIQNLSDHKIIINSDSQYVVQLINRKEKLKSSRFLTRAGIPIQNRDLVELIISYIDSLNIEFIKVKAHQKKGDSENFNRDVDKTSRKIVREYVRKNFSN